MQNQPADMTDDDLPDLEHADSGVSPGLVTTMRVLSTLVIFQGFLGFFRETEKSEQQIWDYRQSSKRLAAEPMLMSRIQAIMQKVSVSHGFRPRRIILADKDLFGYDELTNTFLADGDLVLSGPQMKALYVQPAKMEMALDALSARIDAHYLELCQQTGRLEKIQSSHAAQEHVSTEFNFKIDALLSKAHEMVGKIGKHIEMAAVNPHSTYQPFPAAGKDSLKVTSASPGGR